MSKIMIVGASGHGKVIADIARRNGYTCIQFLDDDTEKKNCSTYPVVGRCEEAGKYQDADFIVAIGNAGIRRKMHMQLIEQGLKVVTLIHPAAIIAENVNIGSGTVIMAGAVINPSVSLGDCCIINTCASVDHDCTIGDYVHISVGAHVAGTVRIGNNAWIGAGATISNDIAVAGDCMIGAGAVVVEDLLEAGTYIGVPARRHTK